jgi:hypothetical protein
MGLFAFFFRPPTINRFAEEFIRALRRAGVTDDLVYDPERCQIQRIAGGTGGWINLSNFYEAHLALSWWKRRGHLAYVASSMLASELDLPDDFAEARSHLRPKIWSRLGLELARLQAKLDDGAEDKFSMPEYEIGSHLVASLVYDLPAAVRSISQSDLENWGITYYEGLECARENLQADKATYAQIGDNLYVFKSGDTYDASRLLVPEFFERLEVEGDMIAIVPNRDTLIVTGAADDKGLEIMAELAKTIDEPSRPLVAIPLRRDGDDWVDWFPAKGHRLYGRFKDLATEYFHGAYNDQKSALERLYEKEEKDVFVASLTAMKKKEEGDVFTYAVWTQGIVIQLPVVDWIVFGILEGEDFQPTAIARWNDARRIVGHLMQPTDLYPARFEVSGFPTEDELEELGMGEMGP